MADTFCGYRGDREAAIVGYLYGDTNAIERASFEAHLAGCQSCRRELDALGDLRAQLAHWTPPGAAWSAGGSERLTASRWARALRDVPAWAQVAAALLFLGIGAGVANLDVRYDRNGLRVRTGWSAPPTAAPATAAPAAGADSAGPAPWRADLAALETRLRTERHAPVAAAVAEPAAVSAPVGRDAELMGRVRALIDESERRQRRELALRVGEVVRDVNAQRRADLVKIDRSLGQLQNNTGVEVMRQRELLNYLVRVSQRQ